MPLINEAIDQESFTTTRGSMLSVRTIQAVLVRPVLDLGIITLSPRAAQPKASTQRHGVTRPFSIQAISSAIQGILRFRWRIVGVSKQTDLVSAR
jgi:hypothetical protein